MLSCTTYGLRGITDSMEASLLLLLQSFRLFCRISEGESLEYPDLGGSMPPIFLLGHRSVMLMLTPSPHRSLWWDSNVASYWDYDGCLQHWIPVAATFCPFKLAAEPGALHLFWVWIRMVALQLWILPLLLLSLLLSLRIYVQLGKA